MNQQKSFENSVVLVTGGASGIGEATAKAFGARGAQVIISDIQDDRGGRVASQIQEQGGRAEFVRCDVADRASVGALFDRIRSGYGKLDVAFNNAGTEGTPSLLGDAKPENWKRTLDINLNGVFYCMQEELPLMLKQGGGVIVNCASIAGVRGFAGSGAYVASKHAVVGLTRSTALDYATRNIRINAVCPGVIETPMIERYTQGSKQAYEGLKGMEPVGRMGRPEEIASAVLWLAQKDAAFVTGTEIIVDGGWCAK